MSKLKDFMANIDAAIWKRLDTEIGGGVFSSDDLSEVRREIRQLQTLVQHAARMDLGAELSEAAHMLATYGDLLAACKAVQAYFSAECEEADDLDTALRVVDAALAKVEDK